jgi:hypothetical protein
MGEADASAEVHQTVHDELQNDIIPAIKSWQKTKYIKSMMHIKPTKDFEEEFKRAQKPWAKLYVKVDKYKRDYHTATKNLKMAETQDNNSKLDGTVPQDQRVKVAEKVERCRKEKEATKVKYTEALQELNRANPKYMDDMNEVFTRCQAFEKDRLGKFREFLGSTEKCLDLTHRLQSSNFQQFSQTIKNCDTERDLACWSDTYGAGMKMNWPTFEEYSEAHRTLSRRAKGEIEKENPVVVTAIRSNNNNGPSGVGSADNRLSTNYTTGTSNGSHSSLPNYQTNSLPSYQNQSSYPPAANPFYEDDEMNNGDSSSLSHQPSHQSPISTGGSSLDNSAGPLVRALYDYEAQEQDELSFKQGDVFTKVEDEDDQGWCKGRVGSRVGLYPATYVEVL